MILNNFVQSSRSTKNAENSLSGSQVNKVHKESKKTQEKKEAKESTKKTLEIKTVAKKEDTKAEATTKAVEATKTTAETELARAREEGKQEALKIARSESEDKKKKKEKKSDKKKKMKGKVDKEVAKRLAKMSICKGGGNSKNGTDANGDRIGGTEVFKGKLNATNALGIVGYTNWSINEAPYKVERCDQILLIKGKKLNLKDYCEKTEAFMTMSIYMINFFIKKDVKSLIDSFSMADITSIPSEIPGTTGCTMWTTKTKTFPFCYESKEVLDQITAAYYKFLNCKNPRENNIAYMLKQNCDLAKMNLTEAGPFGVQGPMFKDILMAMDPNLFKVKTQNLAGVNPYYISDIDGKARAPGDHAVKPLVDPRIANSRFP